MRSVDPDLVDKSIPEHGEMRRLIAQLRQMRPEDRSFDTTMMELMHDVIRHVADEETMLLPDAEMTRRRFQLVAPHAGEIAVNAARTYPRRALAFTGAVAVGALLAARMDAPVGMASDRQLARLARAIARHPYGARDAIRYVKADAPPYMAPEQTTAHN